MKCMILAAGLGKRLRPLTNRIPKPLVKIAGKPLLEHHLEKLKSAGYKEIVINLSYLGNMIQEQLGRGQRFGIHIEYSNEGKEPLGTAGGIIHALPLLGDDPFLVINGDTWCGHTLAFQNLPKGKQAHLVLVNNPAHNVNGDFAYEHGKVYNIGKNFLTYSGIGIYDPKLFKNCSNERWALAPILHTAIDEQLVSAEHFSGKWFDIGTLEQLEQAENYISKIK